jgi:hypothetical protein
VTKSSNYTLNLHYLTSASSTTYFPWLYSTYNWTQFSFCYTPLYSVVFSFSDNFWTPNSNSQISLAANRLSLYSLDTNRPRRKHVPQVRLRVHWSVTSTGHGAYYTENTSSNTLSIVACAYFGRCLEMGLHITIFVQNSIGSWIQSLLKRCSRRIHVLKEQLWHFPADKSLSRIAA